MEERENKEVVKPKKKINVLAISTVMLLLLVLGMGIYIGYTETKMNKEDKKEVIDVEDEEEKVEYLDIYSDEIQNLYNNINTLGCYEDTFDLYRKGAVSMDNFKANAFYMAYEMLVEEEGIINSYGGKELKSFTFEDISKKAKIIFGNDFNVEEKTYDLCPIYKYDSNTKTFTIDTEEGCGCTAGPDGPHTTLYQATKTGNQINIYEAVVYLKYNEGSIFYTYYKDPLYNQKVNDAVCSGGYSTKECIDNSTKYQFTFTKEKNNYILTNITKVN